MDIPLIESMLADDSGIEESFMIFPYKFAHFYIFFYNYSQCFIYQTLCIRTTFSFLLKKRPILDFIPFFF